MQQSVGNTGERLNLVIKQGSTFGPYTFTIKNPDNTPVDLTDIEIRGSIRKYHFSDTAINFDIVKTDAVNGVFELKLSSEITKNMQAGSNPESAQSRYYYDIELDSTGQVVPFIYGDVNVLREITK